MSEVKQHKPTYDRRDVLLTAAHMMTAVVSVGMVCELAFSVPAMGDPAWAEPAIRMFAAFFGASALWGGLFTYAYLSREGGERMDYEALGRRIRSWCVDEGITVDQLAKELGYKPGTVKSWVYGQRKPGLDEAIAIADRFKKPLDELACREIPA